MIAKEVQEVMMLSVSWRIDLDHWLYIVKMGHTWYTQLSFAWIWILVYMGYNLTWTLVRPANTTTTNLIVVWLPIRLHLGDRIGHHCVGQLIASVIIGSRIILETIGRFKTTQGRLKGVQDHQRNYIELKRYAIKFETSGNTFLEVALR